MDYCPSVFSPPFQCETCISRKSVENIIVIAVVGTFIAYMLCNLFPIFWDFLHRFWFCQDPNAKSEYEAPHSVSTMHTYEDLEMKEMDEKSSTIIDIEDGEDPEQIDVFDEVIEQAGEKVKRVIGQEEYANVVKQLKQSNGLGQPTLIANGKMYTLTKLQ